MNFEDCKAYAEAIKAIGRIITDLKPDVLYCPLRGAYPVVRSLDPLVRRYVNDVVLVPTSGFLSGRERIIQSSFENILKQYRNPKIAVVDTAITGSSIRNFKNLAKRYLQKLANGLKQDVDISIVKLWQNRQFPNQPPGIQKDERLTWRDYNVGTKSLLCEDQPDLLGIDYPYEVRTGKKYPFALPVKCKAPIVVLANEGEKIFEAKPSTAETFVELIHQLCAYDRLGEWQNAQTISINDSGVCHPTDQDLEHYNPNWPDKFDDWIEDHIYRKNGGCKACREKLEEIRVRRASERDSPYA